MREVIEELGTKINNVNDKKKVNFEKKKMIIKKNFFERKKL